jgi:hypothetical protein
MVDCTAWTGYTSFGLRKAAEVNVLEGLSYYSSGVVSFNCSSGGMYVNVVTALQSCVDIGGFKD